MAKEKLNQARSIDALFGTSGVKTIFGYPGGSIMPVFDALYDHREEFESYSGSP